MNEGPPPFVQRGMPIKKLLLGVGAFGFTGALALLGCFLYFSATLPAIQSVEDYQPSQGTTVYIKEGKKNKVVAEYFKERRYVLPYERISPKVVQAFLAAEDDEFFRHPGISLTAILRASLANLRAGQVVQGGSTISQQVAKSLYLTPERDLVRKFKELILTYRLEKNLTKEQILYIYLNQIYLGQGAYGVEAASRAYFDKPSDQLDYAEAALLAGMPRAPSKFSPLLNPKRAKERQSYVLGRLLALGKISVEEHEQLLKKSIRVFRYDAKGQKELKSAPYVLDHVRQMLYQKYGETKVLEEGLSVWIPGDIGRFRAAASELKKGLRALDQRRGYRGPVKKITEPQEAEAFDLEQMEALLSKRIPFLVFNSEGRLDVVEARKMAGILREEDLLESEERYLARVEKVEVTAKRAFVRIGALTLPLPFEKTLWAKKEKIQQVVSVGDVVWVNMGKNAKDKSWETSLDQEPLVQGALISMDTNTGEVLALEGGFDFNRSEFNRAIQARRQPGSAFKPLIFLKAIEFGYTPVTVMSDTPVVYSGDEAGRWKPENYDDKFMGDTLFRLALIKSRNIPTINLAQDLSIPTITGFVNRLGYTGIVPQDFTLALGSGGATLKELTEIYSLFPRLGRKLHPTFILKVLDRKETVLEDVTFTPMPDINQVVKKVDASATPPEPPDAKRPPPAEAANTAILPAGWVKFPLESDPDQLMDPRQAYVMLHLMKEVVSFGTGARAQELGRPAAGKTGTTNEFKDAWFVGFTSQVVTGVWVGFDDQQMSLGPGETGAEAALPIWLGYMKKASEGQPIQEFLIPEGIVQVPIDPATGGVMDATHPSARVEAFVAGTQPTERVEPSGKMKIKDSSEFLKEDFE